MNHRHLLIRVVQVTLEIQTNPPKKQEKKKDIGGDGNGDESNTASGEFEMPPELLD